jgi:hypothetical protein
LKDDYRSFKITRMQHMELLTESSQINSFISR